MPAATEGAAAPATPPQAQTALPAAAQTRYAASLTAWLRAHARYPALARIRGWQGVVKIRLRHTGSPGGTAVAIAASSGHELLDRQALALVKQALEAQPPPEDGERDFDLVVPVIFRLDGR